jgi:signal transduction histidine kinase
MAEHAYVVIGADGEVHAVHGTLPDGLLDRPLAACSALPAAVRAAGAGLLQRLRSERGRSAAEAIADGHRVIHVLAVDSVVIRRRATNLRELLPSKLAVLVSQADGAGVRLTIDVAENVPDVVTIDAEKISWGVTTLVGNALRYVQAPSRRLGGRVITVRATFDRAAGVVAIVIADDGPGIPADTVGRLFAGDGLNVRGAGLSLLLVKDVMAAHGGGVDVRSRTGADDHGTAIELTFPA